MTRSTPLFHAARTFSFRFSWICLLCAFCLLQSGIASPARGQSSADNSEEITALQEQEKALKTTIDYLEDTLQKVKSGKYFYGPFKYSGTQAYFGLVDKDVYAGFLAAQMFLEKKTAKEWVVVLKKVGKYQKAAIQALQETLDETKEALEGVQKKLAALRKKGQSKPKPRPSDGVTLELDSSTIDRQNSQNPTLWDLDKESGEGTYTPPYGKATFKFKMPDVIGPEGETVAFGITVSAKKGQRFGPAMSMVGDADLTGGNPQVYPVAESGMTAEESKEVLIKPRQYSEDTKFITIQVRFQDGPTITYKYRVVR
jgi:hypothetical protein